MFFTKARRELARRFAVTSRDDHPSMPLQARLIATARATIQVAEVRLLKACQIRNVTELLAREAARLRAATGRAGTIAATDAIVIAFAATCSAPVILTSDSKDLGPLALHATRSIRILPT